MRTSWKHRCCVVATLIAAFGVGCSSEDQWTKDLPETVGATGVVLLDGEPVEGAAVVFAPGDGAKYPAKALSDGDGEFELQAFPSKSGAVPGKYKVAVSKTIETVGASAPADALARNPDAAHATGDDSQVHWVNALPQKYANPNTSELTADIPANGTDTLKFELSSK